MSHACANSVYQALPPIRPPGNEASLPQI